MPKSPPREEYRVSKVDTGNPNLIVAVRVRPENEKERGRSRRIIKILDEHVLVFDPASSSTQKQYTLNSSLGSSGKGFTSHAHRARDYKYAFDRVFQPDTSQEEVYKYTAQPLIESVLNGYNATVFAYGATGSGKTHTMIGNEKSGPGVMVLTMRDLFRAVEVRKDEVKVKISISYLEVYNETIRDLFVENSPPLMLLEDGEKGARVAGLTERYPKTAEEVFELLAYGNKNRRQSPTAANETSSRSHAVLQKPRTADVEASVKIGKLSLIDLAGSERAAVSENRGDRLKEGANINKSLLALGNCINSLGEKYQKGQHVPYRNSKLTRLLKDSLGGNCRTVMIAAVSPSALSYEDTLNTLKYANRAKNIKTKVVRNVVNVKYHISKYTQIIAEQKKEIEELKAKLANMKPQQSAPPVNRQLEELQKTNARLEENLGYLREIIKEQYQILADHGLVTERVVGHLKTASYICSPGRSPPKVAWMPVKSTSPPGSSLPNTPDRPSKTPATPTAVQKAFMEFQQRAPSTPDTPQSRLSSEMMPPPSSISPKRRKTPRKRRNSSSPMVISLNSPHISATPIEIANGQQVFLLTPKSPKNGKKISQQQLDSIKENALFVNVKNDGELPRSILKKTESQVDANLAKAKKFLSMKEAKKKRLEEKSVLFAFSPESFSKLNTKIAKTKQANPAIKRRASFMAPTQSSRNQAKAQIAKKIGANKENVDLNNRRLSVGIPIRARLTKGRV